MHQTFETFDYVNKMGFRRTLTVEKNQNGKYTVTISNRDTKRALHAPVEWTIEQLNYFLREMKAKESNKE